jgi:hypothetical protein
MPQGQPRSPDPRDFPAQRAAGLIRDAARDAARAWASGIPGSQALGVAWSARKALADTGITLWRLTRFRYQAGPGPQAGQAPGAGYRRAWVRGRYGPLAVPDDPRDPDLLIHRSGFAIIRAGNAIADSEVLRHARQQVAADVPAGGRPLDAPPAVAAALALAAAAGSARTIMTTAQPGPARFTDGHLAARNEAVLLIADAMTSPDDAAERLAGEPGPLAGRLATLRAEATGIHVALRLASILPPAPTGPGDAPHLADTGVTASPSRATSAAAPGLQAPHQARQPSAGHLARAAARRASAVTAAADDMAMDAARAMDTLASGDSPDRGLSAADAMTSLPAGLRHYADRHHVDFTAALAAADAMHDSQRATDDGYAPGTHVRPRTATSADTRLPALGVITAVQHGTDARLYTVRFPAVAAPAVLAETDIETAPEFRPVVTAQGMITTLAGAEQALAETGAAVRARRDEGLPPAWAAISDQGRLAAAVGAVYGLKPDQVLHELEPARPRPAQDHVQAPAPSRLAAEGFPQPHHVPAASRAESSPAGPRSASHPPLTQPARIGRLP